MAGDEFQPIPGSPITLRRAVKVAENKYVQVFMDEVEFADGRRGTHLRVREPAGGAVALVVDEHGQVYLHQAYHYAANAFGRETIRGFGESGESAEQAVLREFHEEAQFRAELVGSPERIGEVQPNNTLLMSSIPVYVVRVRSAVAAAPRDVNEGLHDGRWYTMAEVKRAIASGEIRDGFTLSALALYQARGGEPDSGKT